MEENKKTNEELQPERIPSLETNASSENKTPQQSKLTSDKKEDTSIISQIDTQNPKVTTEAMEIHKHPHHVMHKKKWNEYLLEFFMLFLAVFLGFVAENIRERLVEQHREKEYLVSLLEDLKEDEKQLRVQIAENKLGTAQLDSLATILIHPALVQSSGDDLYYLGRGGPRIGTFTENIRTYEQLKNSGNFRLISDREASDKIMSYYLKLPELHRLEAIFAAEFVDYKKIASQVFEPSVFIKQINEDGHIIRTTDNPSLQTTDARSLKQLTLYVIYMSGSRKSILSYEQLLLQSVNELTDFLEKRYLL